MKKLAILLFILLPFSGFCQSESETAEWEKIPVTSDSSYMDEFNTRFADIEVTLGFPRVINSLEELSTRELATFKQTALEMKCRMVVIPPDQFGKKVTKLSGGAIK